MDEDSLDNIVIQEVNNKENEKEKEKEKEKGSPIAKNSIRINSTSNNARNNLNDRLSVGFIDSPPNNRVYSIDTKAQIVSLNGQLIDVHSHNLNLLGVESNLLEEQEMIDIEPFETDDKSENIFNKIHHENKSTPVKKISTGINSNTNYTSSGSSNKQINFRGSLASSYYVDSNKGKYLFETVQERKRYEEKILTLNNRIQKLKETEEVINKKVRKMQNVVIREDQFKQAKIETKNTMKEKKNEETYNLLKKKEEVIQVNTKRSQVLDKLKDDMLRRNKKSFDLARNDKMLLESMVTQYNSHFMNVNNYKYIKAKQESIHVKTERLQRKADLEEKVKNNFETKLEEENEKKERLSKKLRKLEQLEEVCMESLRKTMENKNQEIRKLNVNRKLNLSLNASITDLERVDSAKKIEEAEVRSKSTLGGIKTDRGNYTYTTSTNTNTNTNTKVTKSSSTTGMLYKNKGYRVSSAKTVSTYKKFK